MNTITKDELALYDRQIRLWGLEAQKKLKEGSILIISKNIDNVVQEICKNLALSGIASIKLFLKFNENESESKDNLIYSNLAEELIGIHPNIFFSSSIGSDLPKFDSFDFIVTCGSFETSEYMAINKKSRNLNKCNIWSFEYHGKFFIFNDFIEFTVKPHNSDPKTLIFPSFYQAINNNSIESCKNNFLPLFYKYIQNQKETNSKLDRTYKISASAIVGALICQEIIKSFSKNDFPINNILIFDSENLKNFVEKIGTIS